MTKSREQEEEEEKSDGLEIISIGSLYSGTWDKKYWSSSRGKDRYPYPVGYQACRAYNGSTYKMEIQEGPKGPLFLITSVDGHFCSGQTPDIAWEKYQKKGCLRMKIWHGKRFSCKMDGIEKNCTTLNNPVVPMPQDGCISIVFVFVLEQLQNNEVTIYTILICLKSLSRAGPSGYFFGFRNPLVQRLLRELVANVNGIAERSLLSSSFCNGALNMDPVNPYHDPSTSSDLLSYLVRTHATGKRSKRSEIIKLRSSRNDVCKKLRAGDSMYGNYNPRTSFPDSQTEMQNSCIPLGAVPASMQSSSAIGEENTGSSVKDGVLFKSVEYCDNLMEKAEMDYEESKLVSFKNNKCDTVFSSSCSVEKNLDRLQATEVNESKFSAPSERKPIDVSCSEGSQSVHDADLCVPDTDLEEPNFPAALECKAVDDPCLEESQSIHDVDFCAPDTLDFVLDNTSNYATSTLGTVTCGVEEELIVTDSVVSEQLANKEKEQGTSNSNVCSERSDFDSVGQDIAKSMMTVLLPQAIPLLKKPSRKKKKSISLLENCPSISKSGEENNATVNNMNAQSPDEAFSVVQISEHNKSVGLDKFDGEKCEDQPVFLSNNVEADQFSFGKDTYDLNGGEQFVNTNAEESSSHHVDTSGIRDVSCNDKVQSNVGQTKSVLDCTSVSNKAFPNLNQDVHQNLDQNALGAEIKFGENIETLPDCDKGTDAANVEALGSLLQLSIKGTYTNYGISEISKSSSSQVPKNVYTRRKVRNVEPTATKHNPSIIKSVGCRKHADGCIQGTAGTSIDSEAFDRRKEVFYTDSRVEAKLLGLQTDVTAMSSNPALESQMPFLSVNQANFCTSEGQDASNLVVSSMSCAERSQIHFEERLIGPKNALDVHCLGSQQEGTGFCHGKTSHVKEGYSEITRQGNLELELNSELDGIVEFLGCYDHPMPVLSLLLSQKGNEIYVCALCGLPVKDRTLFLYKLVIEGPNKGCPCFVGYTAVTWPSSTNILGREIEFERSGLQLTPDGQCLVLLASTRLPCCREGKLDCSCSACKAGCFENKGVKIVQVKAGYVSVLVKLRTSDSLHCLLVCEPHHLVAAGENMRLHLWTMNAIWSEPAEEFTIQSNDCVSPCIKELKKIPKCNFLVIGHDGFGEFTLWDISNRIFLSRFSAPSNQVHQFCPISLVGWQREVHGLGHCNVEAHVDRLMDATKMWLSKDRANKSILPLNNEDIAIWLLVSTAPDSVALHDSASSDFLINSVGCWKLALLVKNTVTWGSPLDPRAAAISTSAGHGIVGTLDGLVYMWEFLTGKILGALHKFKGGSASCIAADDSGSGVLAVADDQGQLLVYLCRR